MISKDKHQKHPTLSRPRHGKYHHCEWAIYGTNCDNIATFYKMIHTSLSDRFKLTFIDADHNTTIKGQFIQNGIKQLHCEEMPSLNEYDDTWMCSDSSAVFVNGNHYPASRQIVILDPKKKDSLERRLQQLTQIDMLILLDDQTEIYDFLQDKIRQDTITVPISDETTITHFLAKAIQKSIPAVKALILGGGKSSRMGSDKSQLIYRQNKTQESILIEICQKAGLDTYLSKAHDFDHEEIHGTSVIKDRMVEMGPFGAILTAFMHDANTAWLVIACDLPFLDQTTMGMLLNGRNPAKVATALKDKQKDFPEPLIAIYEPAAYGRLLSFMSLGRACPRKMLINSDVEIIEMNDASGLTNANTPDDYAEAIQKLKS